MITGENALKTQTKYISCKYKCKFENVTRIKSGITIKVGVSVKIDIRPCVRKKLHLESCYM